MSVCMLFIKMNVLWEKYFVIIFVMSVGVTVACIDIMGAS